MIRYTIPVSSVKLLRLAAGQLGAGVARVPVAVDAGPVKDVPVVVVAPVKLRDALIDVGRELFCVCVVRDVLDVCAWVVLPPLEDVDDSEEDLVEVGPCLLPIS